MDKAFHLFESVNIWRRLIKNNSEWMDEERRGDSRGKWGREEKKSRPLVCLSHNSGCQLQTNR